MNATINLNLYKGGLFSYIGELRLNVNKVPLVDYTGWGITGRFEENNVPLDILTTEWVDITTGIFRVKISDSDTKDLKIGNKFKLYIVLITPADEILAPLICNVSVLET